MPLSSDTVGAIGEPLRSAIDARWTMAYAAGLGDARPAYLDTRARADVLAHPLFPVCFEWPAFLSTRHLPIDDTLSREERLRGVHASHDLLLHRPLRAGVELETRATISRVEQRPAGAFQVVRLDTCDGAGAKVCTTWYGSLFRGVGGRGRRSRARRRARGAGADRARRRAARHARDPARSNRRARLHRVRADLEPDPQRCGGGGERGASGHHPPRYGGARAGRQRSRRRSARRRSGARGSASRCASPR